MVVCEQPAHAPAPAHGARQSARWTFTGTAGQTVALGLSSPGRTVVLRVLDTSGKELGVAYAGLGGGVLTVALPALGSYQVLVTNNEDTPTTAGQISLTRK